MIKEKTFYKSFMILALSLALQNLLTYGVNMMDTLMLGRYSQNAMGGVSLCNQIQFLLQMLVVGAGEGAVVMGSQYWGKKKLEPIPHIIGVALRFGGALAVLLFILVCGWPTRILQLLSNDPAVIAEGAKYFSIIRFTYVIFTITNILVASLRSIGVVKIGYMISGSTLVINVCLNYLLIYGNLGFPEMGVRGAAVATVLSQAVSAAWVLRFLTGKTTVLRLRRSTLRIDTKLLLPAVSLGASPFVMQSTESLLTVAFNISLQKYGGDLAVGAMTILTSVAQMIQLPLTGLAQGAQPILSYNFGAHRPDRMKQVVRYNILIAVLFAVSIWGVVQLAPHAVVHLFTSDEQLTEITVWALRIYMALGFTNAFQTGFQQSFVALGEAKISLFLALERKIFLLIPLIFILPHFFADKLFAVFLAEPVADVLAAATTTVLFLIRFRKITNEM